MQLEIDVDRVDLSTAEARGNGIDASHTIQGGEDGLIHERVATGADDFGTCDTAISFDLDFYRADKRFVLIKDRGRLLPLAEETVMDEFMIPSEFTGCATSPAFASAAGRRTAPSSGCTRARIGSFPIAGGCRWF